MNRSHSTNRSLPLLLRVASLYLLMALPITFFNISLQQPVLTKIAASQLSSITTAIGSPQIIQGIPINLRIERLNINLEVLFGDYDIDKDLWIVDDSHLFFMAGTTEPNTKSGQTVIYGHNTQKILGKTSRLEVGDQVEVSLDSGETMNYHFKYQRLINPSDGNFLLDLADQPRLVLFTCNGLFNEERRLMYFDLVSEVKA